MDRRTRTTAARWLHEGLAAVVVDVRQAFGSVPREAGVRMLVSAHDGIGSIGGGHLELKAIRRAREMLRTGEMAAHSEHHALGPALGQCCGGAVTLGFAALDSAALAGWRDSPPLFRLQLYGAGHVGLAVATLLATLDAEVDWIDSRDDAFPATTALGSPWPAHIRRVGVDAVEGEVRLGAPGGFYLVMTHDHDLDARITEAVLRRADFAYLGLIGSRTKRQRFVHRFERRGVEPAAIARMTCPIGIAGVDAKAPEVIAAAVVAQLLQHVGPREAGAAADAPDATGIADTVGP